MVLIAICIWYVPRTSSRGADFSCFYNVGKLWLEQKSLYFTSQKVDICESSRIAPENIGYRYRTGFYYTPFAAVFLLPLQIFSYKTALAFWTILNIWLIYFAVTTLLKCLPWDLSDKKLFFLIIFILLLFFNTFQENLDFAQTTILTFVFMLIGYLSFMNGRPHSTGFFLHLQPA